MRTISNEAKAALWTALFTFLATASIGLLGFLGAVEDWLNGNDPDLLDDLALLGRLVGSAVIAAASGLLNYVVRRLQTAGALPGSAPVYADTPAGED